MSFRNFMITAAALLGLGLFFGATANAATGEGLGHSDAPYGSITLMPGGASADVGDGFGNYAGGGFYLDPGNGFAGGAHIVIGGTLNTLYVTADPATGVVVDQQQMSLRGLDTDTGSAVE